MFSNLGSGEILIIVLVLFFLFGSKKLPELARGLGESGKELKKAKRRSKAPFLTLPQTKRIKKSHHPPARVQRKGVNQTKCLESEPQK